MKSKMGGTSVNGARKFVAVSMTPKIIKTFKFFDESFKNSSCGTTTIKFNYDYRNFKFCKETF